MKATTSRSFAFLLLLFTAPARGKAPPELTSDASHWLNSKEALKLGGLKGKVVWLEFGFLG